MTREAFKYVPQPAATTFAFPSFWFLFYAKNTSCSKSLSFVVCFSWFWPWPAMLLPSPSFWLATLMPWVHPSPTPTHPRYLYQYTVLYPYTLSTPLTYIYTPHVPIPVYSVYCTPMPWVQHSPTPKHPRYLHQYTVPLCPWYATHLHLHTPGTYTLIPWVDLSPTPTHPRYLYPYTLGTPFTHTFTPQDA